MNKQAVASELVKIAKELTASVRNITLEAWAYQASSPTIVEFTEQGYRVVQKGDGVAGYLHFPMIERKTKELIKTVISIERYIVRPEYIDAGQMRCSATIRSTDSHWNGGNIDSTYGKRGDGKTGVTKDYPLPPHPDKDKKEDEYDEAVMAVLADGRKRTIDWSYTHEGVEYDAGRAPSSPPSEELRSVMIEYWDVGHRKVNAPGLGNPPSKWAFQGLSHDDVAEILNKKIYWNA